MRSVQEAEVADGRVEQRGHTKPCDQASLHSDRSPLKTAEWSSYE